MNSALKNNEYIVFQPDQVLTNDHLNQLFYYLDRQNRLTRSKLIGMGIVCGFELEVALNVQSQISSIQIDKGCGITSQGYLISDCKNKSYTHVVLYTPPQLPPDLPFTCTTIPFYNPPFTTDSKIYSLVTCEEYKTFVESPNAPKPTAPPCPPTDGTTTTTSSTGTQTTTDANQPIPLSSMDWSDYCVVLFLEAKEKDLKNCDMQDCNNKGEKMVFHIRPLLVPKKFLQNNCSDKNSNNAKVPEIRLQRYNVPATDITDSAGILQAFTTITSQTLLAEVAGAYSFCSANYTNVLNITADPFANFQTTLNNLLNNVNNNLITAQYFYDYINDLILAYYEFREVADRLNIQCCGDECAFPLHLVLGAATQSTSAFAIDCWRTYFIYSPLFDDGEKSIEKVRFYFNRMKILAAQFQNGEFDLPSTWANAYKNNAGRNLGTAIKITPSQYEKFPLSQRAIPYYYNPVDSSNADNSLYKFWSFDKSIKGNEAFNLSYNANEYNAYDKIVNAPLRYDIEQYNFFRVEGHIGLPYATTLEQLLIQKQQYNLPIDIIALSAEILAPANVQVPECYIKDLKTEYEARVIEFLCKLLLCVKPLIKVSAEGVRTKTEAASHEAMHVQENDNNFADFIKTFQFGVSVYKAGDFVKSFNPQSNQIGNVFIDAFKTEKFVNPVNMNDATTDDLYENQSYSNSYDILHIADTLFQTLLNTTFEDVDAAELEKNFKAFETILNRLKKLLTQKGVDMSVSFDDCACDCLPCLLLDILWLLEQYLLRRKQYAEDRLFANYFIKHTGLEHKAGVPKGGTFVLVYSRVRQLRNSNENTDEEIGRLQKIDAIVARKNAVVIADFYIPYLCCSDCNPAIVVQAPPLQTTPTVSMPTPVCSDVTPPLAIAVGPDNTGTVSSDNFKDAISSNNNNWTFDPTKLFPAITNVSKYVAAPLKLNGTLTYTINNVNSSPYTVTVFRHPIADFKYKVTRKSDATILDLTTISEKDETTLQYNWTVTPVKQDSDAQLPPAITGTGRTVTLDVTEFVRYKVLQITITLEVANQKCSNKIVYGPFNWKEKASGNSNQVIKVTKSDSSVTDVSATDEIKTPTLKKVVATKTVKKTTTPKK